MRKAYAETQPRAKRNKLIRPIVQTTAHQKAQTARDGIGAAIDRHSVRMIGVLSSDLVGRWHERKRKSIWKTIHRNSPRVFHN